MKKYWIALSLVIAIAAIVAYNRTATDQPDTNATIQTPPPTTPLPVSRPQPAPQSPTQSVVNAGYPFKDTSILKPPAGAKIALYEFEDMECPGCAYAFPIVHTAAAHYNIPLVRRDYPWSFHIWSFDAAITARYIQDKLSPQLADDFRRDIFASQAVIASKDDLTRFTAKWFQSHNRTLPFVMDPNCRQEVESDRALGDRVGVRSTPCIFVVTQTKWIAVPFSDVTHIDRYIESALAETAAATAIPSEPWKDIVRTATHS
jgi:protein-disulfide isomerase